MQKNMVIKNIRAEFNANENIYLTLIISTVIGILIGCVTAAFMSQSQIDSLSEYTNSFFSAYSLQSVNKYDVFKLSVYKNFKLLITIAVSGFFTFLIPIIFIRICTKGFSAGFTLAFLIRIYGGKGILFSLSSLLPNLLLLPALIIYSALCIKTAVDLRMIKNIQGASRARRSIFFRSFLYALCFACVLLLCSLLDGYIIPALVKMICSIFPNF